MTQISGTSPAMAHPHIFTQARLEIVIGDNGAVEALQHVWRFDELFSSSVLLDYDTNGNNQLEEDERIEIGAVMKDSLAEYDYYTVISRGEKSVGVQPPDVILIDYVDGALIVLFSVKPAEEMAAKGEMAFGVFDPTFYTAIDFASDDDLVLHDSSGCSGKVVRPDFEEVLAENSDNLTEAFYDGPIDYNRLMATRLEVKC